MKITSAVVTMMERIDDGLVVGDSREIRALVEAGLVERCTVETSLRLEDGTFGKPYTSDRGLKLTHEGKDILAAINTPEEE